MVPIKRLLLYLSGEDIFTIKFEDFAGEYHFIAKCDNRDMADWVIWSLSSIHNIPYETVV